MLRDGWLRVLGILATKLLRCCAAPLEVVATHCLPACKRTENVVDPRIRSLANNEKNKESSLLENVPPTDKFILFYFRDI